MLHITPSIAQVICFYLPLGYIVFTYSIIFYFFPGVFFTIGTETSLNKTKYHVANSTDMFKLVFVLMYGILQLAFLAGVQPTSMWFGHLLWTQHTPKIIACITVSFGFSLLVLFSTSYFSSKEIYDYAITLFWLYYWLVVLYSTNTLFSIVFLIELLSTLLFLLHMTSIFSTSYTYNNIDYTDAYLCQVSGPNNFLKSLMTLYWTSLFVSLLFFYSLVMLGVHIHSFDLYTIEEVFKYLKNITDPRTLAIMSVHWLIFLSALFIKCGVVPFYVWKPTFFNGLNFHTLIFYVSFFYFYLFLFIIKLLTIHLSSIWYFFSFLNTFVVSLGLIFLVFVIFEAGYLKTFLAVSSILNSILILLTLISKQMDNISFLF